MKPDITPQERLRQLQDEAYTAVMKVLVAQSTFTVKTELMLIELRKELGVNDEHHKNVLRACLADAEAAAAAPAGPSAQQARAAPGRSAAHPTHSTSHAGGRASKRAASHALPAHSVDSQSTADASVAADTLDGDLESRRSKKQKKMALLSGAAGMERGAGGTDPLALVGHRVRRYWPSHGGWFEAVVTDYRLEKGDHCLTYDFGTSKENFEWYQVMHAPESECVVLDEKVPLAAMTSKSRALQNSQIVKAMGATRGGGRAGGAAGKSGRGGGGGGRGGGRMSVY